MENSHEAIIAPLLFDRVQEEIARRKALGRSYSGKSIFSSRLVCGDCGHYNGLADRYDRVQGRINDLERKRTERMAKADAIGAFMFRLSELDQPMDHFGDRLWLDVIDRVVVHRDGLTFKFQNGKEIRV